jgi:hypothetical protein
MPTHLSRALNHRDGRLTRQTHVCVNCEAVGAMLLPQRSVQVVIVSTKKITEHHQWFRQFVVWEDATMTEGATNPDRNTSLFYPFFQNMFDTADATSCFWQPILKAVGRTHLEFAGLQARQSRALLHWTHQMMQPATPSDFFNANAQLWSTLMSDYLTAAPRVAAAVDTVADAVAPTVLRAPGKPTHDTLILLDRDDELLRERRVA